MLKQQFCVILNFGSISILENGKKEKKKTKKMSSQPTLASMFNKMYVCLIKCI